MPQGGRKKGTAMPTQHFSLSFRVLMHFSENLLASETVSILTTLSQSSSFTILKLELGV